MSYIKKGVITCILALVVGIALVSLAFFIKNNKAYLVSAGFGLIFVSSFKLYSYSQLKNDPEKAKEAEALQTDERTQFIAMKSYSLIYNVSIYVEVIIALVAGVVGYRGVSFLFSSLVLLQLLLNIALFKYYGRKY